MIRPGWSVVLGVALVVAGCSSTASASEAGLQVTVTRVVDGDTIHVTDGRGSTIKTRVLGIDTPEVVDPRKPVECGGRMASAFAKAMLLGQPVTLISDPTQAARDRYGRALLYVRLPDGRDYSIEAARAGMARSYVYDHKPVAEHAAIEAAEAEARAAHRGLWRCP